MSTRRQRQRLMEMQAMANDETKVVKKPKKKATPKKKKESDAK